jgi:hypothetical protein
MARKAIPLQDEGYALVMEHIVSFRDDEANLTRFLITHQPSVVLYDLALRRAGALTPHGPAGHYLRALASPSNSRTGGDCVGPTRPATMSARA